MRLPTLLLAAALLLPVIATPGPSAAGEVSVDHAWMRPTLPGRPGAAYMSITNAGATPDLLIAIAAEGLTVELHTVLHEGDVMKMQPVEGIELPAGETVALAPGGFHAMIFGIDPPLAEGTVLPLVLSFEQAGEIAVEAKVSRRPPEGAPAGAGHGGGHGHGHGN